MKKLISVLLLIALLLLSACTGKASQQSADSTDSLFLVERSYATPEAAVEAYAAGLAANDLRAALSACSFLSTAEGFDFWAYTDRINTYLPTAMNVPSDQEMFRQVNAIYRLNQLTGQIKFCMISLLADQNEYGEYLEMKPVMLSEEGRLAELEAFIETLDLTKLQGLRVVELLIPSPNLLYSVHNLENFARQAAYYGADEMTERLVVYELDGQYYIGGVGLLRYGDDWKIQYLTSNLAGLGAYGAVVQVDEETLEELRQESSTPFDW